MENKQRKLCRSCKYSNDPRTWTSVGRCNYICVTGHMRGCPAADCDKYERGKRLPSKLDKSIVIAGNKRDSSLHGKGPLTEEERLERRRARDRERYKKNREKNLEYQKAYRQAHKEELAEYHRNYQQEHKEEIREKKRRKRQLIAGVDGNPMEIPRKVEE